MTQKLSREEILEIVRVAREKGERPDLSTANLSGADLSEVELVRANLSAANLSGADLSMAYLNRADLSMSKLNGANLGMAYLNGAVSAGRISAGPLWDGLFLEILT